jgi:hypothetical protein
MASRRDTISGGAPTFKANKETENHSKAQI